MSNLGRFLFPKLIMDCKRAFASLTLALLGLVWICPGNAAADQDYSDEELLKIFSLTLEELFKVEIETAGKKTQSADQVAASAFVITADDLFEGGFTTINEALTLVPGLDVARNWRVDPLTVRGIASGNERILLLINGYAMTSKGDNLTTLNQFAPVDINEIERIEVIMGPGSALYGSGAFLAIVNVFTKPPQSGASVYVDASSVGPRNLSVNYGHREDKFAFSVNASTHDSNGDELEFDFVNGRPPQYIEPSGIADGFNRVEDNKFSFRLDVQDVTLRLHYSEGLINWPTSEYFTDFNSLENYNEFRNYFFQLEVPFIHDQDLRSTVRSYYNDNDHTWHGAYDGVVLPTPSGDLDWHYGSRYYGIEYQLTYEPSNSLSLVSGVELTQNPEVYSVDFSTDYSNASIYAMTDFQASSDWRFNMGLRAEKYSFRSEWELIPKAAVIFKPARDKVFKLLYGKAFLAASAWELQVAELIGSEELKPELFESYELVYEQLFTRWSSSLSLFSSTIINKREILDTGFADTSYVYNSSNQKTSQGADWHATYLFDETSAFNLGVSYASTDEIDEVSGLHQPMFGASKWLGYLKFDTQKRGGVLALHGKYRQSPESHPWIDSSTRIDIIYSRRDFYGMDVSIKIANLLDDQIASYTTVGNFDVIREVPDNGRYFALRLEKRF